jgi:hypothetical protein
LEFLSNEEFDQFQNIWKFVSNSNKDFKVILDSSKKKPTSKPSSSTIKLVEINNKLIAGCISELDAEIKSKNLEKKVELVSKIYVDEQHWHNKKEYFEEFAKFKFVKKFYPKEQTGMLVSSSSEQVKNSTFNIGVKIERHTTDGWKPLDSDKKPHIIVSMRHNQTILNLNIIGRFQFQNVIQIMGYSNAGKEVQIYHKDFNHEILVNLLDKKNLLFQLSF